MRRVVHAIGWLGLAGVVTVSVVVGGVYATHPRDESSYLRYVQKYAHLPREDARPTSADLVAAGDRACDWLSHRVPALWRTGPGYGVEDLYAAYGRARDEADRSLPSYVVAGAWSYLCPATELLVKPHYVFSDPPGSD